MADRGGVRVAWWDDDAAERAARLLRGYDPVKVSERLERLVEKGLERRYFRFRGSRFYGGSAVGDVVLCNLRCVFCWTGPARDDPRIGFWVDPSAAGRRLLSIARSEGYRVLRLSAGEPTLGRRHLIALLDYLAARLAGEVFVLETNGILLASDGRLLESLERHRRFLHVRVSIKACNRWWFQLLTGASADAFELQLRAVEILEASSLSYSVAVFAAFGSDKCWAKLLDRLASIMGASKLRDRIEVEAPVLYRHARRRLQGVSRLVRLEPRPEMTYPPA
ncbi:MAG: radical SAM protein [Crenarchaeota archaeon]|nr:radical SAM protein [Thermoproteota archaeon]